MGIIRGASPPVPYRHCDKFGWGHRVELGDRRRLEGKTRHLRYSLIGGSKAHPPPRFAGTPTPATSRRLMGARDTLARARLYVTDSDAGM